jgi:hypothetical protein
VTELAGSPFLKVKVKGKAVPLHAMQALGGRGSIAPTPPFLKVSLGKMQAGTVFRKLFFSGIDATNTRVSHNQSEYWVTVRSGTYFLKKNSTAYDYMCVYVCMYLFMKLMNKRCFFIFILVFNVQSFGLFTKTHGKV